MKSVGEVMAIGRTFRESLGKAIRSLEVGRFGFDLTWVADDLGELRRRIVRATPDRCSSSGAPSSSGLAVEEAAALTHIDPWFLTQIAALARPRPAAPSSARRRRLRELKRMGVSDRRIAVLSGLSEDEVRTARLAAGVRAVYKRVDTCAAEFEARTPYMYSTYEVEARRARARGRRSSSSAAAQPHRPGHRVRLLLRARGHGPARRGLRDHHGQLQPETVSTDYDTSDRLYFEPLTREDVLSIIDGRSRRRDRAVRRADSAGCRPAAAPGVKLPRHQRRRHRPRRGPRALRRGCHQAGLQAPRWGVRARAEAEQVSRPRSATR
jgi:carbamoyl-phosphate synthase large subunit